MRHRKTDYGTIILHWLLVAAFAVAFVSGLRIATEAPERTWINLFDAVLPRRAYGSRTCRPPSCWSRCRSATPSICSAPVSGAASSSTRFACADCSAADRPGWAPSTSCCTGSSSSRCSALMVSGGLLYFGFYAGHDVATLHWYGTWVILGFVVLHVLSQYRIGGASQLLRIFRPTRLTAPPPRLDAVELLTLLAEQSARLAPDSAQAARRAGTAAARCSARDRIRRTEFAPRRRGPRSQTTSQRLETAKPDVAIQSFRGRRRRRDHRRLGHRGNRPAERSTSCRFTASAAPMRPSSTATPPIGPGATSSRSR